MDSKILVITDSASDITRQSAQSRNIRILPIMITSGGRTFAEYYDITPEEYCALLRRTEEVPHTAQVPLATFTDAFEQAKADGYREVLVILINGSGSGTYSTACIARDLFMAESGGLRIEILDSRGYTMMYGHIVEHCAEMASAGAPFDEIVAYARQRISKLYAYLGVYSLKYLKKSGRISGGAAFVGEALGLRPISLVRDGAVTVCDKVRGDRNLFPRILALLQRDVPDLSSQDLLLMHGDLAPEAIETARQMLLDAGARSVRCCCLGPSLTTNTGPDAIAVVFTKE